MPIIITGTEQGGLSLYDPDADAKVGRWCAAPYVPDLCSRCFDPDTLGHYPAAYYWEKQEGDEVWRHGACERCKEAREQEGKTLIRISQGAS